MKSSRKKIIGTIVIVIFVAAVASIFKMLMFKDTLSSRQAWKKWETISSEKEDLKLQNWKDDITYLEEQLTKRHKDLFHTISKEEFQKEISRIENSLATLSDIGKFIEIKTLVAKIGDGHTRMSYDIPLNWFPISVQRFKEGVYVISASEKYQNLLGKKLIKIGDTPIEEISETMSAMLSHDNEVDLKKRASFPMKCADFLKYYGYIDSIEKGTFVFEDKEGKSENIEIESYYHKESVKWVAIEEKYDSISKLKYTKNYDDIYWYDYMENEKLLYFQYNRCMEDKDMSIKKFTDELIEFVEQNEIDKFVFDIRNNGGGNSMIIEPLINRLAEIESINQQGKLFVVIGNNTYSSAILNAIKLKQDTNAILIGEPTGGKPNHYGEVRAFNLPNSGLRVSYSTKYFKHSKIDTDSIYPDINIEYSFYDFINGVDPVLEKINKLNNSN